MKYYNHVCKAMGSTLIFFEKRPRINQRKFELVFNKKVYL